MNGKQAEQIAKVFLLKRGFRVLDQNVRFHHLEIDLVSQKGNTLVFVEVKSRRNPKSVPLEESVSWSQQRRLKKAAQAYLIAHPLKGGLDEVRFDCILIDASGPLPQIHHIENAF
jgi:putative endonuclease